jgi:flagellar biosynthesis/type III secretory pathway M-ring protein FliF/YscJ
MGALRQLIARINAQMTDLTASQRLAIGLCVVIIAGSFLWLARWSTEPELVRLLEEPMTIEQLATAREALSGEPIRIVGDSVFVPPRDRHELFWKLQSAGALPEDTSVTFARLIEDDSPFRPESENLFRRRVALQNELAKVIASSKGVKKAEVFITDTSNRRINAPNQKPSASIHVTLAAGHELDQDMVTACASIVAGAVPGLLPHSVSVIDGTTLRTYTPPDPEDAFAHGLLQEVRKNEEHLRDKLETQLSYIPGVRVAVTVQLDPARTQRREYEYAKPAIAEEETSTTESRTAASPGESGVGPNVGQSLAGAAGGESTTSDETRTRFQDQAIKAETTTVRAPMTRQRVSVAIGIPASYVAGVVKRISGTDDEPPPETVEEQFQRESQRVRAIAKNIIMARDDQDVTVELFTDLSPAVTMLPDGSLVTAASHAAADVNALGLLRDYGPEAGLTLLALVSLLMMSRLVRGSAKGARHRERGGDSASDFDGGSPETFGDSSDTVGLAEPSEGSALFGKEIDEASVRGSEMARQVTQFVQENPAKAAQLIRRWTDAGR